MFDGSVSAALLVAALLTAGIAVAHSVLGERDLIRPLLAPENRVGVLTHPLARQTLHVAWHITTVAWIAAAAVFAVLAVEPVGPAERAVLALLAAGFLLTGLMMLVWTRGRHLAWAVFFAIAGAAAWPVL